MAGGDNPTCLYMCAIVAFFNFPFGLCTMFGFGCGKGLPTNRLFAFTPESSD